MIKKGDLASNFSLPNQRWVINRDRIKKQKNFHEKYQLDFDLLCDEEETVCKL